MTVIWLNATVGAGKTAVGTALAQMLPSAVFMDGDDHAGPSHLPNPVRWQIALENLLRAAGRKGSVRTLVIAYPLDRFGYAKVRAACHKSRRRFFVINLATPIFMTLRSRGGRSLSATERTRIRVMRSEGYHCRPFAQATLRNVHPPPRRTALEIRQILRCSTVRDAGTFSAINESPRLAPRPESLVDARSADGRWR